MSAYPPGTVVHYVPAGLFGSHCREGIAIANARGQLVDTFWQSGSDAHVVTHAEMPSVEVLFHLDDYDEIDRWKRASATWETYHPNDRQVITSQHGLQYRWFIRKGAQPDLGTQIANAEERVREAESELRSAELNLQWRRDELSRLQALTEVAS